MNESLLPGWYFAGIAFVMGACVGSFLNVVIYRIPAGRSVVTPGSTCQCGKPIPWYNNIPILSWLFLRGRAACCGERFSIRYPLVELGTALLFMQLWIVAGWPAGVVLMLYGAMMVAVAFIDLDTMEIPDRFSIGGFALGLILSGSVPAVHGIDPSGLFVIDAFKGVQASLLGGFVGSGLVLWVALLAEAILRKEAMGFGDVKLMGAIGAFCGWQGAVFAFFGGAVLGTIAVVIAWPFMKARKDSEEGLRIPFGPALVAGSLLYLLFMRDSVDSYFLTLSEVIHETGP
jgi:leader peptidase (prepilin peptidase)/N-methyltransferase